MDGSLSGHPNARACGAPQHQASGVLLPQSITVPLVPTPPCEREHSTCAPRKVNLSAWRASGSETEGRANLSTESLSGSNAEATLPPGDPRLQGPQHSLSLTDGAHLGHTRIAADGRASHKHLPPTAPTADAKPLRLGRLL